MPSNVKNTGTARRTRGYAGESRATGARGRRPGCRPTKPCARTGTASSKTPGKPAPHSFYAKGYMDIIPRIRKLTENPDIPAKSRAPLIQVLENHQRYLSTRKHILDYPGEAERHMDARAPLQDVADESGNRAGRGSGLRGLAAGGRTPHGCRRGHPLRQGNLWLPS